MVTLQKSSDVGERNPAAAQDHERFIERHRPLLLGYLDVTAPAAAEKPNALAYVDSVLAEWHELFDASVLGLPTPEERTFWCALYQLEDLVELPGPRIDPFEKLLMENLMKLRELLRHQRPLPLERFFATRPDGT